MTKFGPVECAHLGEQDVKYIVKIVGMLIVYLTEGKRFYLFLIFWQHWLETGPWHQEAMLHFKTKARRSNYIKQINT